MEIIKECTPIARKEYICDYCGGVINVGEKYIRQTDKEGHIYDLVCHTHCQEVAHELNMFDRYDMDGLSEEAFREFISEYVYEHHYDESTDDIAEEWNLTLPELVKKVYEEIKEEKNDSRIPIETC